MDFPTIRQKNVKYFNLVHAHEPKFVVVVVVVVVFFLPLPVPNFFVPFYPPFSRSFNSCYLLRFIFFLAVPKR